MRFLLICTAFLLVLSPMLAAFCNDSDGGIAPDIFGNITNGSVFHNDSCIEGTNYVWEWYCDNNTVYSTDSYCTWGCEFGKCKTITNCTDTDGGYNIFKKGTVNISSSYKFAVSDKTDYCVNSTVISEYYCNNSTTMNVIVRCPKTPPPGYICLNGSCIMNISIPNANIKTNLTPFLTNKTYLAYSGSPNNTSSMYSQPLYSLYMFTNSIYVAAAGVFGSLLP